MKTKQLIILAVVCVKTLSLTAMGEIVEGVGDVVKGTAKATGEVVKGAVQVPGKVVKGTGEVVTDVGQAVTPAKTTDSVAEAAVRAPGIAVEGTGKIVTEAGEALTPPTKKVKTEAVVETMAPEVTAEGVVEVEEPIVSVCQTVCPVPEPTTDKEAVCTFCTSAETCPYCK